MKMGQICVYNWLLKLSLFLCIRNTNLSKSSNFLVSLIDNCCERATTLTGFLWRLGLGKSLRPVLISISGRVTELCLFLWILLQYFGQLFVNALNFVDLRLKAQEEWFNILF